MKKEHHKPWFFMAPHAFWGHQGIQIPILEISSHQLEVLVFICFLGSWESFISVADGLTTITVLEVQLNSKISLQNSKLQHS